MKRKNKHDTGFLTLIHYSKKTPFHINEEKKMGLTSIEAIVTGPDGKQECVKFMVDSGASYTLLPIKVWKKLGLKPKR